MRAIHALIQDGWEFVSKEPEHWEHGDRIEFIAGVEFMMTFTELAEFNDSAREIALQNENPIQIEAFKHARYKAESSIVFSERNIEIIKSYTYANDKCEESENRSNDYANRYQDALA